MASANMNVELGAKSDRLQDKFLKLEQTFESAKRMWKEERAKIGEERWKAVVDKKMLQIDLSAAKMEVQLLKSSLEGRDGQVATLSAELKALERRNSESVSHLEAATMRAQEQEKALLDLKSCWEEENRFQSMLEEFNCRIATLLAKNEALDRRNSALEREKAELEAQVGKMKVNNNIHEAERNSDVKKIKELVTRVGALERMNEAGKKALQDATKKKDELIVKLKRQLEMDLEATVRKVIGHADSQSSAREKRLRAEEKKKAQELLQRIEVCEREKGEIEAKVERLEREVSREKEKVLNGRMAMEAKEKKTSELVQKINVLETEKKGLEKEITAKAEAIKVVLEENDCLEEQIKKLKMEIKKWVVKSEVGVESSQNEGIQAQQTGGVPHSEEHGDGVTMNIHVKMEDQMSGGNVSKSKRPLPEKCDNDDDLGSYGDISTAKRLKSSLEES